MKDDIRAEAEALGIETDLGLDDAISPAEALTRIDRFVCDIKESQFGDGLHVFGRQTHLKTEFETQGSVLAEQQAIRQALSGQRIEAGPSGSPYRAVQMFCPPAVICLRTRCLCRHGPLIRGVRLADEFIRRHLQDHGDWPSGVIVDLWGSATMRTAGEEFAMALHLVGLEVWAEGTERVSGFESSASF